jgi:RNA polymerase sigma factor (sigma-70 family)
MENEAFPEFLAALQRRDPQAFEQLIALCGPEIRALIRSGLEAAQLRPVLDSVDLWQSILLKFDQCVQKGQFHAETFAQLRGYLRTLARNKLMDHIRRAQAAKRSPPPVAPGQPPCNAADVADSGTSPSQLAAYAELEQQFLQQLSPEARQILRWRTQGWTWRQIAAHLGRLHSTIRIHFNREIERALQYLGLQGI